MGEAQSWISSIWICLYSILQLEVGTQLPAKDNSLSLSKKKKLLIIQSKFLLKI